jgi:hypothetical protein
LVLTSRVGAMVADHGGGILRLEKRLRCWMPSFGERPGRAEIYDRRNGRHIVFVVFGSAYYDTYQTLPCENPRLSRVTRGLPQSRSAASLRRAVHAARRPAFHRTPKQQHSTNVILGSHG